MPELYISTGIMLLCALAIVLGVAKLSAIKVYIHKQNQIYENRFEILEQIIKKDIKNILEILKK